MLNETQMPQTPKSTRRQIERRAGRFKITRDLINDWRTCRRVMKHFVPFQIEWHYWNEVGIYTAFSELFDLLAEGEEIPMYEIMCHKKGRQYKITARRLSPDESNSYGISVSSKEKS